MEQADRCGGCGTYGWEWDDPNAFGTETVFCPGCAKRARADKTLQSQMNDSAGYTVALRRHRPDDEVEAPDGEPSESA